jgi:hypothetical protein
LTLETLCVAAALLQREFEDELRRLMGSRWRWLPDPHEFALGGALLTRGSPREKLGALGKEHQRRTRTRVNWSGTHEQAATRLLRRWEVEDQWSR